MGAIQTIAGDYESALSLLNDNTGEIPKLFGKNSQEKNIATANIAWVYGYMGNGDKELEITTSLLDDLLKNSPQDYLAIADCYNSIGLNWHIRGDFNTEREYLKRGTETINNIPDISFEKNWRAYFVKLNLFNSLSLCYLSVGDNVNAYKYAKICSNEFSKINNSIPFLSINYMTMGRTEFNISNDTTLALISLRKALDILKQNGMDSSSAYYSYNGYIAAIKIEAGDYGAGIKMIKQIIDSIKNIPEPEIIEITANNYYTLIQAFINHGDKIQAHKSIEEAIAFVTKNKQFIRPYLQTMIFGMKAKLSVMENQFDDAEKIYKEALAITKFYFADSLKDGKQLPVATSFNILPVLSDYGNLYFEKAKSLNDTIEIKNNLNFCVNVLDEIIRFTDQNENYFTEYNSNQTFTTGNIGKNIIERILKAKISLNDLQLIKENRTNAINILLDTINEMGKLYDNREMVAYAFRAIENSKMNQLENQIEVENKINNAIKDSVVLLEKWDVTKRELFAQKKITIHY